MGIVINKYNNTAASCIYCYAAADNYNLESRIRKDHYGGKFQPWWVRYSVYVDYEWETLFCAV